MVRKYMGGVFRIVFVIGLIFLAGCASSTPVTTENDNTITKTESVDQVTTPLEDQTVEHVPEMPYRRIELGSNISNLNVTYVENRVLLRVNSHRGNQSTGSLVHDEELSKIARYHSYRMVVANFYDHVDPKIGGPSIRMNRMGYNCPHKIGENIHAVPYNATLDRWNQTFDLSTEDGIAEFIVESWNHSRPHRIGMLDEEYEVAGVGIFVSKDGRILVTMEFCG